MKSSKPSISGDLVIKKTRRTPENAKIFVKAGDTVNSSDIIAQSAKEGKIHQVAVSAALGISPGQVFSFLKVKEGDPVKKDELLALNSTLFGMLKSEIRAPVEGIVESISSVSGHLLIREKASIENIAAFVNGRVLGIGDQGIEIESRVSFLQGVFGVGQEVTGKVIFANDSLFTDTDLNSSHPGKDVFGNSSPVLRNSDIVFVDSNSPHPSEENPQTDIVGWKLNSNKLTGSVLVFDKMIDCNILKKARDNQVSAVIAPSIDGIELEQFAGRKINFASTGTERIGLALFLTEGFGNLTMSAGALTLLKMVEGSNISVSPETQVRAGVIRPEILGPFVSDFKFKNEEREDVQKNFVSVNSRVKIIAGRYRGHFATVTDLPAVPVCLESGVTALVYKVLLDKNKKQINIPRPNIETVLF